MKDSTAIQGIAAANATAPQWTIAQFVEILQSPRPGAAVQRTLLVAEDDGVVTGFAVVSALGIVYPVQAELESIAVRPQRHGQGIGRALLQAVLHWCGTNDVAALRLEVRVSNRNAISLYERTGFLMEGIRPGYYERPTEDAMCMLCSTFPGETLS